MSRRPQKAESRESGFQKLSSQEPGTRSGPETVLLLGRASQILLTVARSLGRRRLAVEVATAHPEEPLLRSRYVAAVHTLPPYRYQPDRWLEELLELIRRGAYRLLLPMDEPSLYAVRTHRRELEDQLPLAMLDDETFEIVFDKARTHQLAASLGVPVPRQTLLRTLEDGRRGIRGEEAFTPPFVLKPLASYGGPAVSRRRDVRKVYDNEDLEPALEEMLEKGPEPQEPVLLQENVRGTGYGVEVLAADGEILLSFAHRRIHEPIHGGGSSYRKSIDAPEELAEASRKILRALRYTGVAMIEFKVDEDAASASRGRWVLLEINGRFWGSLPLPQAAGADFPYSLYRLLVHGEGPETSDYRRGLYCRNLAGDAKWLLANLRADRSDPLLATRPLPAVAAEIRHLLLLRERWDTFSLDDPRPAVAEVRYYAGLFLQQALDRLRAAVVNLPPVRRRLARRGSRAIRRSRRVLFVCKGNICRSPFAALYLRQRLGDAGIVTSSGFYPIPHRPSPPEAVAAAAELGVDLADHRSSVLTFRDVRRADVLVSFDEEVHRTVGRRFPEARWKLHRLASLPETASGTPRMEFEDPFGGDQETFRESYRRIADAIDRTPWAQTADSPEEPAP
ncbi:MAG: ATP-grasp domain-containing protein [Acidobacteriota bacterium]|nr:ATP-grasp domain-containing protein [Acidobacteriota bacterium]